MRGDIYTEEELIAADDAGLTAIGLAAEDHRPGRIDRVRRVLSGDFQKLTREMASTITPLGAWPLPDRLSYTGAVLGHFGRLGAVGTTPPEPARSADAVQAARFLRDVIAETDRARRKFPTNTRRFTALVEEVGEIARAINDNEGGARIYKECVQVASMALRFALEGDADFGFPPRGEPGAEWLK